MTAVIPFLALLIAIIFPSSNLQLWNGLPLSTWPEFFGLAVLLPFLLSRKLRFSVLDGLARIRLPGWLIYVPIFIIFIGKLALLISGVEQGFSGCYRSPALPTAESAGTVIPAGCERSYEDPFQRSGATRFDQAIVFGQDSWNLVFLNSNRFDYYDWEPGTILRSRIPLMVDWRGTVDVPQRAGLKIIYAGSGVLTIGESQWELPPAYQSVREILLNVPAGSQDFHLRYAYDDQSRSGMAESDLGPRAQIQVLLSDGNVNHPLQSSANGWWGAIAALDDLLFGMVFLFLGAILLFECRADWLPMGAAGFLVALTIFWRPNEYLREGILMAALLGVFAWHWLRRKLSPVGVYLVLFMISFGVVRLWLPSPAQVLMRSAGNDPLGFESQAYTILATGSLQGGEDVFYAQPMFRYVVFSAHAFFGDGNAIPTAGFTGLFLGAAFFLFSSLEILKKRVWQRILVAILGSGILCFGIYYVAPFIRDGLSEYVTWILLLFILPFFFLNRSALAFLLLSAGLAFSYTVRANQLVAIVWMMMIGLLVQWRRNRFVAGLGCALFIGIGLLPLLHNLFFGHSFTLTTTSADTPYNLSLPPSTWLAFLQGDPNAIQPVGDQLRQLFLLWDVARAKIPVMAVLGVFLFGWLFVVTRMLSGRKWRQWPILLIPVFYLAPHLFYVINTYYPRHIVIGYLSAAVAALVVLAMEERSKAESEAVHAVESSRPRSDRGSA